MVWRYWIYTQFLIHPLIPAIFIELFMEIFPGFMVGSIAKTNHQDLEDCDIMINIHISLSRSKAEDVPAMSHRTDMK